MKKRKRYNRDDGSKVNSHNCNRDNGNICNCIFSEWNTVFRDLTNIPMWSGALIPALIIFIILATTKEKKILVSNKGEIVYES